MAEQRRSGRVRRWLGGGETGGPGLIAPAVLTFPLTSERLALRPFTEDDAAAMLRVYGDPEVMRWVGYGAVASVEAARNLLRQYVTHQTLHGFGFWAVTERATGEVIGDAGLARTIGGEVEMGYTLARDRWGQGLGTEVAALCTATAFGPLGLPRIRALVEPPNMRSQAVLTKLGFRETGTTVAFGRPHLVFVRTASDGA